MPKRTGVLKRIVLDEAEADELLDLLEEVEAETPSTPPATLETNIQLQLNFQ